MADRAGWQGAAESELRALGRSLEVPPASDLTAAVRARLGGRTASRQRHAPGAVAGRLGWRAALAALIALLAVLIATPQGRAAVARVFQFAGVELRQAPGPPRPAGSGAALPGQRRLPLERARHQVSFPILVPSALGHPDEVVVSDGGRVVSLIYRRTAYGLVRMDEYAGHLDQAVFEKFVHLGNVTEVRVNGTGGLWIKGPQELVYISRSGALAVASARLTSGNTLIWGTRRVAVRLEGNLGMAAALAIAGSAR